jgi:hypothetical protein
VILCGERGEQDAAFENEIVSMLGMSDACQERLEHIQGLQLVDVTADFAARASGSPGSRHRREYRVAVSVS